MLNQIFYFVCSILGFGYCCTHISGKQTKTFQCKNYADAIEWMQCALNDDEVIISRWFGGDITIVARRNAVKV